MNFLSVARDGVEDVILSLGKVVVGVLLEHRDEDVEERFIRVVADDFRLRGDDLVILDVLAERHQEETIFRDTEVPNGPLHVLSDLSARIGNPPRRVVLQGLGDTVDVHLLGIARAGGVDHDESVQDLGTEAKFDVLDHRDDEAFERRRLVGQRREDQRIRRVETAHVGDIAESVAVVEVERVERLGVDLHHLVEVLDAEPGGRVFFEVGADESDAALVLRFHLGVIGVPGQLVSTRHCLTQQNRRVTTDAEQDVGRASVLVGVDELNGVARHIHLDAGQVADVRRLAHSALCVDRTHDSLAGNRQVAELLLLVGDADLLPLELFCRIRLELPRLVVLHHLLEVLLKRVVHGRPPFGGRFVDMFAHFGESSRNCSLLESDPIHRVGVSVVFVVLFDWSTHDLLFSLERLLGIEHRKTKFNACV